MSFKNPVAGAGETLAAFMTANAIGTLVRKAENGWAEADEHATARLANFESYIATKYALMDITGATSAEVDSITDLYRDSELLRVQMQNLQFKFYGTPKKKHHASYGYGMSMSALSAQHQKIVARFSQLGIKPAQSPLHHDIDAVRAVHDRKRLAEEAKAKAEAERVAAVRAEIERRQAEKAEKWEKRKAFFKGMFGGGGHKEDPKPETTVSVSKPATPGPRPEEV